MYIYIYIYIYVQICGLFAIILICIRDLLFEHIFNDMCSFHGCFTTSHITLETL